ncbi:MAG: hypothetical protein ACOCWE_06570 [Bacillota bacterium]
MAKINGPLCTERAGKVFSDKVVSGSWRGINYVRKAWKQPYTNSQAQSRNRMRFVEAVRAYQGLDCQARESWQQLAQKLNYNGSGYNLFISQYLERSKKD